MRSRFPLVMLVAACCLLVGCTTPLGSTSYPNVAMEGIEGTWEILPRPDEGHVEPPGRLLIDVRRADARDDAVDDSDQIVRWTEDTLRSVGQRRYFVAVRFEGEQSDATPFPIELEGEFLRTRRWTLFTFQRSVRQMDWTGLSTPLQRTVRVRHAPGTRDELIIDVPKAELLYTPVPLAGELRFRAPDPSAEGQELVQSLDDAIRSLETLDESGWRPQWRVVRVK